jgi:pilus assembly protein CpaD
MRSPAASLLGLTTVLGAVLGVTGCASTSDAVPTAYLENNPLERNPIRVTETADVFEIAIEPGAHGLTPADRADLEGYIERYRRVGSGRLIVSAPQGTANAQAAHKAANEVRSIAFALGVPHESMMAHAYPAQEGELAPLVLSFRVFDAVAPECLTLASINVADMSSNNELPNLGCAVRANMAAMMAEPRDLLGLRPLGPADAERRAIQTEKYRAGEPTGATRSDDERGRASNIQ